MATPLRCVCRIRRLRRLSSPFRRSRNGSCFYVDTPPMARSTSSGIAASRLWLLNRSGDAGHEWIRKRARLGCQGFGIPLRFALDTDDLPRRLGNGQSRVAVLADTDLLVVTGVHKLHLPITDR